MMAPVLERLADGVNADAALVRRYILPVLEEIRASG